MTDDASARPLIEMLAPLSGWVLPLSEVPDPVFAQGLAGDGVAIEPTSETLHAPCDGEVQLAGGNRHALTLRTAAGDLLLHVGIDTVRMDGRGFTLRVTHGQRVRAGQPLLDFDLAQVVRGAASAVTPVLLGGDGAGAIRERLANRAVTVGQVLMLVAVPGAPPVVAAASPAASPQERRRFRVGFEHGLHARPAAQLAAALQGLSADVRIHAHGREASARSTVGVMALGVAAGELVTVVVGGADSAPAWLAISALLSPVSEAQATADAAGASGAARSLLPAPRPGTRLPGVIASRGLAGGVAVAFLHGPVTAAPPRAQQPPGVERSLLAQALGQVRLHLARLAAHQGGAARSVVAAHGALLADPELLAQAEQAIVAGAGAGAAWSSALATARESLAALDDPRMAERRADLLDLERQVLRALAGESLEMSAQLPEQAIVIADELLPSQFLGLDATRLTGVCMAAGGATSHVAILATARGLPMLVGAGDAVLGIAAGTPLLLDAEAGELLVDPDPPARANHARRRALRAERLAGDRASAAEAASTRDGTRIRVYCNLGRLAEAAPAVADGADGCGLLRTEFLFLERREAPTAAEQRAEYQAIAQALAGRPLTIRTLDAGGDKPIAYLPQPREPNPALGLRGLRASLAQPELLAAQLEAILQVQPAGQCRILLPMVTDAVEVRAVREVLASLARAAGRHVPPLGVMIETPAAALLAEQLCREVEFLSIGSNDLAQYTLAMDRQHPTLAARLDGLHPAVLRLIARVGEAAAAARCELGLCGGLASDPLAVPVLLGLGLHEFSVAPAMIATIKGQVRRLALADCRTLALEALELQDAVAVRARVRAWLGEE